MNPASHFGTVAAPAGGATSGPWGSCSSAGGDPGPVSDKGLHERSRLGGPAGRPGLDDPRRVVWAACR